MILKKIENIWDKKYLENNYPWKGNSIPYHVFNNFIKKFNKNDLILDYGCGDGFFSDKLIKKELKVIACDISKEALNLTKRKNSEITCLKTNSPKYFSNKKYIFDGLFIWGVFHHIKKEKWDSYLEDFKKILKKGGYILIGGHSKKNIDFKKGYRVSPTTNQISHAIDDLDKKIITAGLYIEKKGNITFKEKETNKKIKLKYFLIKNNFN